MTMRNPIPALSLLLAAAASAWSAGAERLPLREIDRPLVLPARMWQERLIQNTVIEVDDPDPGLDTEAPRGFFPSLPAYSFTDRLMWMAIPAPYLRYLLLGNPIDSAHGMAAQGLSLALEGGLTGFAYSQREGWSVVGALALTAKRPFSARFWGEGQLGFGSGWISEGPDATGLFASAGLGIQLGERFYLKPICGLGAPLDGGAEFLRYGTLEAGAHLTHNLSLGVQISLIAGEEVWINPGANLAFQW